MHRKHACGSPAAAGAENASLRPHTNDGRQLLIHLEELSTHRLTAHAVAVPRMVHSQVVRH